MEIPTYIVYDYLNPPNPGTLAKKTVHFIRIPIIMNIENHIVMATKNMINTQTV